MRADDEQEGQRALPTPCDESALRDYLADCILEPAARDALLRYLNTHFRRFMITLGLVPDITGMLLEVGARPYFFTLLLKKLRRYELSLTNHSEAVLVNRVRGGCLRGQDHIVSKRYGEHHALGYWRVNVDLEPLPFRDASFRTVIFCEVLEHLLLDPVHALLEMRRVLVSDGFLVLSTPNAARLSNVLQMVRGEGSVHAPYQAYGIYARHNREYTLPELRQLLTIAGYRVGAAFTADLDDTEPLRQQLSGLGISAEGERGEYCFALARPNAVPGERRPAFLYE